MSGEHGLSRREVLRGAAALGVALGAAGIGADEKMSGDVSKASPADEAALPRRRLGKTEYSDGAITFGGIALAPLDQAAATAAVHRALDQGVTHFDVAPTYADSETKIAPALETVRDRVFLACKTLERSADGAARELRASLQRTGAEPFDLYQLHAVDNDADLSTALGPGGALEAVLKARDAGLVRFIGITGHWPQTLVMALKQFPFDTVMTPVNYVDHFFGDAQGALLPRCEKMDVGVIAMKSTMRSAMKDHVAGYRYALSQPVATVVPAGNVAEIEEAIGIARTFRPMSIAEQQTLWLNSPALAGICRQCHNCLPCPKGVDIPYIFVLEGFGQRYRPQQAADLYGRLAIKAGACTECGLCDKRCPYGIEIARRMKEMDEKFASWAGQSWAK
jgi:predicted aldo/keto reductase-like oxidoreductase